MTASHKLRVSVAGGAWQTGGVTATAGQTVDFSPDTTAGIESYLWEIYDYPVGFACGWTLDAATGVYSSIAASPPQITLGAGLWGPYGFRLTVNGGVSQYVVGVNIESRSDPTLIDEGTSIHVVSANGLVGLLERETTQFNHDWTDTYNADMHVIDGVLGGAISVAETITVDGIGAAQTPGLTVRNTTAATAVTQQNSPMSVLRGQAWIGGVDTETEWATQVVAGVNSSKWVLVLRAGGIGAWATALVCDGDSLEIGSAAVSSTGTLRLPSGGSVKAFSGGGDRNVIDYAATTAGTVTVGDAAIPVVVTGTTAGLTGSTSATITAPLVSATDGTYTVPTLPSRTGVTLSTTDATPTAFTAIPTALDKLQRIGVVVTADDGAAHCYEYEAYLIVKDFGGAVTILATVPSVNPTTGTSPLADEITVGGVAFGTGASTVICTATGKLATNISWTMRHWLIPERSI